MYLQENEKAQVVMFFGSKGIVKELLYPEFEALLDNYVPLPEWAGKTAKVVYAEVNSKSHVTSAVFFLLAFTKGGMVEPSWNIPLADLARTTSRGPDMGAGPIHLACASQCPIAFYHDQLWDPDMKSHSSHFSLIKKAVKHNSLGILFKKSDTLLDDDPEDDIDIDHIEKKISQRLSKKYETEMRNHMAQMIKDQRLRTATMETDKENAVKELRLEYARKIEALTKQLDHANKNLKDAQRRNEELNETISGQVQKIEGLREYFEHKIKRSEDEPIEDISELLLEEKEAEMEAKVAAAKHELTELLRMKQLEVDYWEEHETELRNEIQFLREENQDLLQNSGDHLLEKLSRKGVNFVTYQPGAGHITIPLSEVAGFIENPTEFTASFLNVSPGHYEAWLQHFQAPVCKALDENGEMCCEGLDRISTPIDFVMGESDFCEQHSRLKMPED